MIKKSLLETHPELCKEWHPTKNGDLIPEQVTAGSNKKIWWLLPYDDAETEKHFDFEWQATIASRASKGRGCPFLALANTKVWSGFNDLATKRPDLAAEWHPTKNGDLTPQLVTAGSGQKVWWRDKTGKEWKEEVRSRAKKYKKIHNLK